MAGRAFHGDYGELEARPRSRASPPERPEGWKSGQIVECSWWFGVRRRWSAAGFLETLHLVLLPLSVLLHLGVGQGCRKSKKMAGNLSQASDFVFFSDASKKILWTTPTGRGGWVARLAAVSFPAQFGGTDRPDHCGRAADRLASYPSRQWPARA